MLELKAGVFIGAMSGLVRDKLWEKLCKKSKFGSVIMVKGARNEQRFEIQMNGNPKREISDFDGLKLITLPDYENIFSDPKKKSKNRKNDIKRSNQKLKPTKSKEISTPYEDDDEEMIILFDQDLPESVITEKLEKKRGPTRGLFSKIDSVLDFNPSDYFHLTHDSLPQDLPKNFLARFLGFNVNFNSLSTEQLNITFGGNSTYSEYKNHQVWPKQWFDDIKANCDIIAKILKNHFKDDKLKAFFKKNRIVSLDIETTDYLPKAYEGFVNIIGLAYLNLTEQKDADFMFNQHLTLYQVYNMTRKKPLAHHLIQLTKKFIDNADILLVFNRDFDLDILNTVATKAQIKLAYPDKIVDLCVDYENLYSLEEDLKQMDLFQRELTEKGKYSYYYKLFKGYGSKGTMKQIEPIGVYNITDTLSPLIAYLVFIKNY